MDYGDRRADIQVLRAFAVLIVIVFHLNADWLPNGYLGVDVFFVISGYVITRSIWHRYLKGIPFSVHTFFARRIARLLPALLFTVAITFILGFLLYAPGDYLNMATSAIYAIGGLSNIYFFTQTDYFSAPLETMPLLHTWSLSVEEQFYILFALISYILTIFGRNFIRWSMFIWTGFLFLSLYFVFSGLGWVNDIGVVRHLALDDAPSAFKFYLLPSRIYQLALGVFGACLVAAFGQLPINNYLRKLLWWLGFAVIFLIIFTVNAWHATEAMALIVCLLIFMILVVGEGGKEVVSNSALRPLVLIGNRSYSLYLVHWPLTVFISFYMLGENKLYTLAVSVIAIVLLGEISYRVFERRKWFASDHTTGVSAVFVYILLLFLSVLFFVTQNDGLKFRIENKIVDKFYKYNGSKLSTVHKGLPEIVANGGWVSYKRISPKNTSVTERILLLGDSHAGHLTELAKYYVSTRNHSWTIYNFTGCPPVFGYYKVYGIGQTKESPKQKACGYQTKLWKDYISKYSSQYDVVVLSARWNWMFEHSAFNGKKIRKDVLVKVDNKELADLGESRENFINGLNDTVRYIQSFGLRVVVIGQPPLSTVFLNTCNNIPKYILNDKKLNRICNPDPYDEIVKRAQFVDTILRNPESFNMPHFDSLIATDVFCNHEKKVCKRVYYGQTMFDDDNHYNSYGAIYLAKDWENKKYFPFK